MTGQNPNGYPGSQGPSYEALPNTALMEMALAQHNRILGGVLQHQAGEVNRQNTYNYLAVAGIGVSGTSVEHTRGTFVTAGTNANRCLQTASSSIEEALKTSSPQLKGSLGKTADAGLLSGIEALAEQRGSLIHADVQRAIAALDRPPGENGAASSALAASVIKASLDLRFYNGAKGAAKQAFTAARGQGYVIGHWGDVEKIVDCLPPDSPGRIAISAALGIDAANITQELAKGGSGIHTPGIKEVSHSRILGGKIAYAVKTGLDAPALGTATKAVRRYSHDPRSASASAELALKETSSPVARMRAEEAVGLTAANQDRALAVAQARTIIRDRLNGPSYSWIIRGKLQDLDQQSAHLHEDNVAQVIANVIQIQTMAGQAGVGVSQDAIARDVLARFRAFRSAQQGNPGLRNSDLESSAPVIANLMRSHPKNNLSRPEAPIALF